MVCAVYDGEPRWHGFSNFRPQVDDIDLSEVPDEVEDSVGFLSFTGNEKIFALDGQHRLAGIKNALKRNKDFDLGTVSLLLVSHSNSKEGLKRTRQLFTTLNKTARAVGKGEIIALDENDTMAIVARRLFDFDPLFSAKRIKFAQADNVSVNDTQLTTIGNLYDVLYALFRTYPSVRTKQSLRFIRPSDEELDVYTSGAKEFFRLLGKQFTALGKFFRIPAASASIVVAANRTVNGGHVLFRPIGLRIFAELTAILIDQGESLTAAMRALGRLPVNLNHPPYADVIWRNERIYAGGRVLARDLLLYMLGFKETVGSLKERLARAKGQSVGATKLPSKV
jgi:DNA sulfur modification protein DndB